MLAPLGRILILVALAAASMGVMASVAAVRSGAPDVFRWARRLTALFGGAMIAANLLMITALVSHDFSVEYVAQVGSRSVPLWVSIVSLWSSLEGSILFWGGVMALYILVAVEITTRRAPEHAPAATAVWLACAAFFSFLLAGPAQPFNSVSPVPLDGPGPNPLLQNHLLMAVHPPFLYLGFVGLTIPFGLACAALLRGRTGVSLMALLRSSLLLPWVFLTVAIVLGGWWAYEVLGWGGYWAWDPVENASLLPWLTATAALHSAIVTERRGLLRGWTMTLILATYVLTILGTFMTRSGVFNSVHSFTQSDIGPTILVFLGAVLVWSVLLLAARIDRLEQQGEGLEDARSREAAFFVNNLLFVLLTFTVLIGTLFPLIVEAVQNRQMSVGRPYFDRMAVPVGLALLFMMGVGPALPWGRPRPGQLKAALLLPFITATAGAALALLAGVRNPWTVATCAAAGYTAHVTVRELLLPSWRRWRRGEGSRGAVDGVLRARRRTGAYLAHAGVIILFVGIAVSSTMGDSRQVQLSRGEATSVGPYTLTLRDVVTRREPHRDATIALVDVSRGTSQMRTMQPRMNLYHTQREPIGTPDVHTRWNHDLYLSVVNIDPSAGTAGLNVMINPMVSWIWAATGVIALGGLMAFFAGRRSVVRQPLREEAAVSEGLVGEAG